MKLKDVIFHDYPQLMNQLLKFPIEWSECDISGVSSNSCFIQPGWMFVAIKGNKADGHHFISEAFKHGAVAIVISSAHSLQDFSKISMGVPILIVENTRIFLSLIAARLYGKYPDKILAVTGTSGKTSVASFVRQICQYAGLSSAQIGEVGMISHQLKDESRMTTPDPVSLAQTLAHFSSQGITHVSIEASSHGLDQYRLDGIKIAAGSFTHLGRDHIDYHKTIQAYFNAKMRLFEELLPKGSPAVIFADDIWSKKVMNRAQKAGCNALSVGYDGQFIRIKKLAPEKGKQHVSLSIEGENWDVFFPLQGEFQFHNALVAAGMCIATGIDIPTVMSSLEKLEAIPGRLEFIGCNSKGGKIYVDYAHTPDSLTILLQTLRSMTLGRIIMVFGCGGDRDRGKRKIMGLISLQLADVSIVTDDNPRSEDPEIIRADIIDGSPRFIEEGNRQKAILLAISMLEKEDILVVAGKGYETVKIVDKGKTRISIDCDIIRELLLESSL
ncbi:MAG: UDP-N-acetylmuramoyl-L-alanyl-D-glutamate--2,6-diaminopimelate ligase [Candidatus Liberibacter ctenarytainae]|uniref:UDP-N-acetylmuramoyl-L-alanyl-D-glutamate--2,6-diaminopimelate ligase n=1 Tax=Candidatus Liberibacter ctenarytainae TaxID=2020335 RepID=A0A937ALM6_9HYPH|nr:UDP-N-acetylmuramoyl-L-alanyl-D-glutamate--2,6-diaminopimelate ligase [Candidatus Liberibacter ctenarytainae]